MFDPVKTRSVIGWSDVRRDVTLCRLFIKFKYFVGSKLPCVATGGILGGILS